MKPELIQTDVPGLYKETSSGALINKNNDALLQYKKKKEKARRLNELEKRMQDIELKLQKLGL
jgi:hypothetical protein